MKNISCIIPAYNEERTIFNVVSKVAELKKEGIISEIIVISDGSKDKTANLAKLGGADKVIEFSKNIGKAGALIEGIKNSEGEILLFLDADLIGLEKEHLKLLIEPIIRNMADMVVGYLENQVFPNLSGQRIIKKNFLDDLIYDEKVKRGRYNWEIIVNEKIKRLGGRILYVYLSKLDHIKKTKKHRLFKALFLKIQLAFGFLYFYTRSFFFR